MSRALGASWACVWIACAGTWSGCADAERDATSEEGPLVYESEVHGKPFQLYDDTVIAFGEKGEELFRTKVEEPVFERPKERINWV